ncbi:uncharacterized protein LOC118419963 [Branchiostoma floridae]|uniref:Uncharacterized protein LOC118419963 n=1 Tax=Branchiostoma floridae TaxID=7739 RepID=A0A9J7LGM3_BRAFL|nr:uncharacterized protein LOC118419963 [Branchiostoma floridae]
MPDTTTGAGKTIGSTNETSTPTVAESTSTVADVATGTPQANGTQPGTPSDEPSHDVGHQHTMLYIGLALGLSTLTMLALIGVGCKRKKIYQKIKCMKKCWERKPTTDMANAALLPEEAEPEASDVESADVPVPEVPPDVGADVSPELDQYGEQEETGETSGEGTGQPDKAVPIPAAIEDGEDVGMAGDNRKDETAPKGLVSGRSEILHPPGLKEDDDDDDDEEEEEEEEEESKTDFLETVAGEGATNDTVAFVPDYIQRMPLEKILDNEDLLGKMKVKLERRDRHYRNIASFYGLKHDEVDHIEFIELASKDSPFKAILEKVMSENDTSENKASKKKMSKNKTVGELLQYCNETIKRSDVVRTVVDYFVKNNRRIRKMTWLKKRM